MMHPYHIGVVIPVYQSEQSIARLVRSLCAYLKKQHLRYKIILVNDGSTDKSAAVIDTLALSLSGVTAVQLSGNFGQQNALVCGLGYALDCQYIVTMDDDLQHPHEIGPLYREIQKGFDLVYAIPQSRQVPLYRRAGSLLRDLLFAAMSGKPGGIKVSSFRIMTNALAAQICSEQRGFIYLSASAFCYHPKTGNIPFTPAKRVYGKSGYTPGRLVRLYANLFIHYTRIGKRFRRGGSVLFCVDYVTERREAPSAV